MSSYVIDTQALVKLLTGTSRIISQEVDQVLRDADLGLNRIIIPSVVIFEVAYLHEKGRIPVSVRNLRCLLEDACNYIEAPLSIRIIECAFEIKDIPEIHDRLIRIFHERKAASEIYAWATMHCGSSFGAAYNTPCSRLSLRRAESVILSKPRSTGRVEARRADIS